MSKEFPLFTTYNSYISPYASGIAGEELLTEFNQRAALNALGKHPVNQTARVQLNADTWYDLALNYEQGCTGSVGENDLQLSIRASTNGIILSQGSCLIAGYYFELVNDVVIPFDELFLGDATVINPGSTSQVGYYAIWLQLKMSGSSTPPESRGQRLIPVLDPTDPNRSIYQCVQLVCGSESDLEAAGESCLLLGIISKNLEGNYYLWNNPLQTSIIPLDRLAGYDDLARWARLPDDALPESIYGIKSGSETNTVNITDKIWLDFRSPLGAYLRYMTTNPDQAGQVSTSAKPLGTIVGSIQPDSSPDPDLLKLNLGDANIDPSIQYRILQGNALGNLYLERSCPLPKASYAGYNPSTGTVSNAKTGMITGTDLYHLRTLWESSQDATATRPGREFGPFETIESAEAFKRRQAPGFFQENDFYWVVSDITVINNADKVLGTVSGTSRISLTGSIPINANELTFEGVISGDQVVNPTFTLTSGKITQLSSDRVNGTLSFAAGQSIQLTIPNNTTVPLHITDVTGTATSVTLDSLTFDAISRDTPPVTTEWTATNVTGRGNLSGLTLTGVSSQVHGGDIEINAGAASLSVSDSTFTLSSSPIEIQDIQLADVTYELKTVKVTGEVSGQGTVSGDTSVSFTGTINEVSQNVSSLYVYAKVYDEATGEFKLDWVRRGCIRGFSAPATSDIFGFVKVSDGTATGGIVLNDDDQLVLNSTDIERLNTAGFSELPESIGTLIMLTPSNATEKINLLSGKKLPWTITLRLADSSDWNANDLPTLSRIRGDLIIDLTNVSDPALSSESGSTALTGTTPVLNCEDIDNLTINAGSATGKINVKNCTVGRINNEDMQALGDFNNIYRWNNSRFISGSPTVYPDNAWAQIDNPFGDNRSTVFVRFASFTRGEYGITGGELDVWIERDPWSANEVAPEDIMLVSTDTLKFPPLVLKLDSDGNILERQDLPEDLNFKVAGSAGVNMTFDAVTSSYVQSGDLVTTIDWESEGKLSFNARLIFQSGSQHSLKNVRFRVPVQVTPKIDMLPQVISYTRL